MGRLVHRSGGGRGGGGFQLPAAFLDVGSPELSEQAGIKM